MSGRFVHGWNSQEMFTLENEVIKKFVKTVGSAISKFNLERNEVFTDEKSSM